MLISKETLKKLNLPLITLSFVACFVNGLVGNGRGSIFPDLLNTFHLTNTQGALFFSLASATGLAANFLTYKWYPYLGPIRATTLFLGLFALGTIVVSVGNNFEVALFGAAIIGFALAATGFLVNVLAAESTSDTKSRRQVLAGLHSAFALASMLAPLIINALASGGLGWRAIFFVLGLTPVAAMILALKTKQTGEAHVWKTAFVKEKPWARTIWYATVCSLYVAVETLISTRLALYARVDLGFEMERANFLLSTFFLMFFVGRIIFAVVRSSHSNRAILLASGTSSLLFFIVGLFVNPWGLALCGLGCSVFYPCIMALLSEELGGATAFAMSWCQTAQSASAVVMHALVGWLSDKFGLQQALLFGPICLGAMLLLLISGFPSLPRENTPEIAIPAN